MSNENPLTNSIQTLENVIEMATVLKIAKGEEEMRMVLEAMKEEIDSMVDAIDEILGRTNDG